MDYKQNYERWLQANNLDEQLKNQLIDIARSEMNIKERFYKSLEFGTGGLRGIIGVGTNRMNKYTVRKATQGLAQYIKRQKTVALGVVIAYDSRHMSRDFAKEAGLVLAQNRIKAYVFKELRPTPMLSFAVRHLGATAGIVITASHNPPEYNGYKVYWADGAQISLEIAEAVTTEINKVEDELSIKVADLDEALKLGWFHWIGEEADEAYHAELRPLALQPPINNKNYKVVFTPLHGTGNLPVRRALKDIGFEHVYVVTEQEFPDPNFSTVNSPNPEEHAAFLLAIQVAEQNGADMIMGTDPDADRVGVAVRDDNGKFFVLTGNQLGVLLLDYILARRNARNDLATDGVMIKTIVTSEMGAAVAAEYGIQTINTLTGFKFIGEKIKQLEATGVGTFVFAYEESCGYLIGDFCRDKDAIQACMVAAEMGAYYANNGKSVYQALTELYEKIGFYKEDLISLTFYGVEGATKMNDIMDQIRKQPPTKITDINVTEVKDYEKGIDNLPPSNVIKFLLEDDSWFAIRPSGTEPKIKFYFGVKGISHLNSVEKLAILKQQVINLLN